eukprot:6196891-Pleurochrysis_carterae.AAC.1
MPDAQSKQSFVYLDKKGHTGAQASRTLVQQAGSELKRISARVTRIAHRDRALLVFYVFHVDLSGNTRRESMFNAAGPESERTTNSS